MSEAATHPVACMFSPRRTCRGLARRRGGARTRAGHDARCHSPPHRDRGQRSRRGLGTCSRVLRRQAGATANRFGQGPPARLRACSRSDGRLQTTARECARPCREKASWTRAPGGQGGALGRWRRTRRRGRRGRRGRRTASGGQSRPAIARLGRLGRVGVAHKSRSKATTSPPATASSASADRMPARSTSLLR